MGDVLDTGVRLGTFLDEAQTRRWEESERVINRLRKERDEARRRAVSLKHQAVTAIRYVMDLAEDPGWYWVEGGRDQLREYIEEWTRAAESLVADYEERLKEAGDE